MDNDAVKDLWWLIGIVLFLFIIWYVAGGPGRDTARRGPFIEPPAPIGSGETYGGVSVPEGWRGVSTEHFLLALPPHWAYRSFDQKEYTRGEFRGEGVVINYEYGGVVAEPGTPTSRERIDGYRASIFKSNGAAGLVGAYFPNLPGDNRLALVAYNLTEEEEELVLQIIRTIRFNADE